MGVAYREERGKSDAMNMLLDPDDERLMYALNYSTYRVTGVLIKQNCRTQFVSCPVIKKTHAVSNTQVAEAVNCSGYSDLKCHRTNLFKCKNKE